ncbi:MAG: DMT family transporter [Anaerolineae bacterium]|nr:DMT family transporter [Anaerolineae bacterium]MDW8070607.1 DMT family transporter [Anaerolineae bacterium]
MWIAYVSAAVAAVLWGTSFLLTRMAMNQMGPLAVAALRWWITSCVLMLVVNISSGMRYSLRRAWREWPLFLALGIIGEGVAYVFQNLALAYTTTVDVGLIMNAYPILSAVLGVWVLREPMSWRAAGGLVMGLFGVTLITLGGVWAGDVETCVRVLGNGLALLATLAGAFYIVAGKRLVLAYGPLPVTALAGLIGALAMTPVAVAEGITLRWSAETWGALLGLALGCGAAAYLLWWHAAKQLPISQAGVFLYLTPVVSTLLGVWVLNEPLTLATAAGAGLVLGGMTLAQV